MTPCLNWKELEHLIQLIRPEIEGLFVDRLIIPERTDFPQHSIKSEWVLRLSSRKSEGTLLFSIRPRHPYLAWQTGKGPKAAQQATHSAFVLALSKHLKGSKLLKAVTLPKERIVILWFSSESVGKLGLILVFIPAAPEAYLVTGDENQLSQLKILARSRTFKNGDQPQTYFTLPSGSQAPPQPEIRKDFFQSAESFYQVIETSLKDEAFSVRVQLAEKTLKQQLKQAQERLHQSETALHEAKQETDWQKLGDLLKTSLSFGQTSNKKSVTVMDYETEKEIEIPLSILNGRQLNIKEQIEKFYHHAKRKQRRMEEAQSRIDRFTEVKEKLESTLSQKPTAGDWGKLLQWERMTGVSIASPTEPKKKTTTAAWLGKTFTSKEGLMIYVGRNKDENLELTFKHARGNDLWMHIRGRPGAHVLIPLSPGKSAPLETLLDAATLAIHYSGGTHWGKTEVDYTYKKYVKRIKDSTEASYINNKTLLVEPDASRKKRLLGE